MYRKTNQPTPKSVQGYQNRFMDNANKLGLTINDLEKTFQIKNAKHKVIGLSKSLQYMLCLNEDKNSYYLIDPETIKETMDVTIDDIRAVKAPKVKKVYETVKMKNIKFDASIFNPMLMGTPLDYMFSTKGGIMPATNYMVIGDPGIGKSTLTLDILANVQKQDPTKKVLFISGEMNRIDMFDYVQRYPKFGNIDTIFLGEYLDENPKEVIEDIISQGYDLVLADSFVEIQEAIQESNKISAKSAEKLLIDLMVSNNQANNDLGKYTSFLMIQQMTKGGTFVGSNKLKHNTTGMMEIRYTGKSGDRAISFSKNRRGCEYERLHFSLDKGDDVSFDTVRLERDLEIKKRIENEKDQMLAEEAAFQMLFNTEEDAK